MIIFPAVDIRQGKAVRLRQGRKEDFTIFADSPLEASLAWQGQGAEFLHLVDLDAAFGERPNFDLIGEIASTLHIPVQVGGGIRNRKTAASYLDAGVNRLITGTLALENRNEFAALCKDFPGCIGVSLDALNGKLKSRGWQKDAGQDIKDLMPELEDMGAAFIIYTDIERDGMQSGVNLGAVKHILELAHIPVIIAGGVASLEDIRALYELDEKGGLEGVISGRALYEKTLDLPEAIQWLKDRKRTR